MLTIQQSQSAAAATRYFDESLSVDDSYYLTKEAQATWSGELCQSLGLQAGSAVKREQFVALLSGQHPVNGKRLSQTKRSDRRPCIDLTVSCPKSVSLAAIVDPRIEAAFLKATDEFLERDVEPLIHRRVRTGKYKNTRQQKQIGKGVFARFLHHTARATESGPPDSHMHVHCLAFNAVKDGERWYAAEMERVVTQRATLQAKFESRRARRLLKLGYTPQRVTYRSGGKVKQGWELRGIDRDMIERHSKRAEEIEAAAKEAGLTGAVEKRGLAQKTRKRKSSKSESLDAMKAEWLERMTPDDRKALLALRNPSKEGETQNSEEIGQSVRHAVDHCFERNSTVEMNELVGEALRHGVVHRPEEVEAALKRRESGLLQREKTVDGTKRIVTTTPEILAIERETIALAKESRGTRRPLNEKHVVRRDYLNDQQKAAVQTILTDRNGVTIVAGHAGTGKSTMLAEAKEGIEAVGKRVYAVAPSTGAAEVLREKGFAASQTAAHLIHNKELQAELRDQTLFVDEAGLLDMRSCRDLLQIGKKQNCRVVLIGDTRQHASPGRGEPYRLIQREAGLKVAKLAKVQRQQGDYRAAVETIAKGSQPVQGTNKSGVEAGFEMLATQGKVHEASQDSIHDQLTARYFQESAKGRSAIIVAPTHADGRKLSEKIRGHLKEDGKLGETDRAFEQLVSLNLTEAEKRDLKTYEESNLVVQFTQNVPGIKRGSRFSVIHTPTGPKMQSASGETFKDLPLKHVDRLEVYQTQPLDLAVGDHIRLTHGGKDQRGKRITNGKTDRIKRIHPGGQLEMKSGMVLAPNHGHLAYAYTSTSFRAQGADADVAIASLSSQSLPAVNSRTLYVSASRGKKDVALYCDDIGAVERAIGRAGEEQTAIELMQTSKPVKQVSAEQERDRSQQQRHAFISRIRHWKEHHQSRRAGRYARDSTFAAPKTTVAVKSRRSPR